MLTKRKNHIVITEKTSTKTIEEDYKQVKSGMKLLIYLALIEITVGAADLKLRGRELKKSHKICMYLGKEFGFQTFEVPFGKSNVRIEALLGHLIMKRHTYSHRQVQIFHLFWKEFSSTAWRMRPGRRQNIELGRSQDKEVLQTVQARFG